MSTVSLDAASAARKARLSQLKTLKRKQPTPDSENADPTDNAAAPAADDDDVSHLLSGRNYDIENRAPKMGFLAPPSTSTPTLEEVATQIAASTLEQTREEEKEDQPIDLFKLQPKKPNWDLKRDVDKKLEKLAVKTDMAIAKLVRQQIEETKQAKLKAAGGKETGEEAVGVEGNLARMVAEREKEDKDDRDGEVEEEE